MEVRYYIKDYSDDNLIYSAEDAKICPDIGDLVLIGDSTVVYSVTDKLIYASSEIVLVVVK